MLKKGLTEIEPDKRDYSLVHTFGLTSTEGLPENFSIYDGRPIPNQNDVDMRFNPALPPLPFGCTGETGAFESGLQDGTLYDPQALYLATPPGGQGGRDIRAMLQRLIDRGPQLADGSPGPRRKAYFNCYGSGAIDDFDAARFGLWINQQEKRGVYIGSYFYAEFVENVPTSGVVPVPSFNTREATLHCYLATGWRTVNGILELECITWQGEEVGFKGVEYFSREIYNALMAQPNTGAFTITKIAGQQPVPVGIQAIVDHLVYYVLSLFKISPIKPPQQQTTMTPTQPSTFPPIPEKPAETLAEAAIGMLGRDASPKNLAPNEFGCAESVSNIIHACWPDFPAELVSTDDLYTALKNSTRFKQVSDPVRGCVVVSPRTPEVSGHTGIYIEDDSIASNDSSTGLFKENYTRQSWRDVFITGRGLKGYLFEPVEK